LPVYSLNTKKFFIPEVKGKGRVFLQNIPGRHRGVEVQLYLFLTSSLVRGGWSTPYCGCYAPWKEPWNLFYRSPGGPQCRSGQRRENLLPIQRFES